MTERAVSRNVWVNGRLVAESAPSIAAIDRGLTLGDGLFETMRARGPRVLFLEEHLQRLRDGAAVLEINLPHEADLHQALVTTLRANALPDAVVRLTVTRGADSGRGVDFGQSSPATVVVRVSPFVSPSIDSYSAGWTSVVVGVRRNESSPLSRVKSCSYGDNVLARRQARIAGAEEAVLLNAAGQVACGSTANIACVVAGTLCTPSPECGVLSGITMGSVLSLARNFELPVSVRPIDLQVLRQADEAFLTNSVAGVMPLTSLDGESIGDGRPGPITRLLGSAYNRLVDRLLGDPPEGSSPVAPGIPEAVDRT